MKLALLLLVLLVASSGSFSPTTSAARTWHITPDGTGEAPTIQAGIDSAAVSDTVLVACGTYYEHDITYQSGVVVRSETGEADCVVIDAQQQGRIFYSYDQPNVMIEGFTLIGGIHAGGGGAILCCCAETSIISDCVFIDNSSSLYGGALHYSSGIVGNELTLIDCTFVASTAIGFDGAAIYVTGFGEATAQIDQCSFYDNVADYWGGAIVFQDCVASVTSGYFYGNIGHNLGGALFCDESNVTLTGCTFTENQAGDHGGAIFQVGGSTVVTGCTFSENVAFGQGGCFYANDGSLTIENSILAFSGNGAAVKGYGSVTFSCNDVFGNVGGNYTGLIAGLEGVDGNFSANPMFCGEQNAEEPFTLASESPCTPENQPDCGLIGALPVGCTLTGADDIAQLPMNNWLHQNYPNPFNPQTTILFELPEAQHVRFVVYTVHGRHVTTRINEEMSAGQHTVTWGGRDDQGNAVASGTYIYRLEAGDFIETKRMVLIR